MTDPRELSVAEKLDYNTACVKTQEEIQRLLKEAPAVIRHMTRHLAKASGKMIRARTLLACAMCRDEMIHPNAVRAAASAELLHLATLVHDDIIDNADKRRGIDTLHRKFGEKYAVLCGDYLFCAALDFVSSLTAPTTRPESLIRAFPRYLTEVCLGELRQNQNNQNYGLSEREYFRIIRGKTAALFEACFYAGFILSDAPDDAKEHYTSMGNDLGIIFQLSDDCADYTATTKQTKKPVLSDYSHGVITLPLIYAIKKDSALAAEVKEGIKLTELKTAVEASGGLIYTQKKIEKLYLSALSSLESLHTSGSQKQILLQLLQKAAGIRAG